MENKKYKKKSDSDASAAQKLLDETYRDEMEKWTPYETQDLMGFCIPT